MHEFEAQKQGGFFRYLFSFVAHGSWGKLTYDEKTINWKSSLLNFGGEFSHSANELQSIAKAKYIDFGMIPRTCYRLTFNNGNSYKFTFKLNKEAGEEFLNTFANKKNY